MKKIAVSIIMVAGGLAAPVTAAAQEVDVNGCYVGDYQGVPIDVCPPPVPDPTNCYTGWYQGAPEEVCMPTGWEPDPTWTYNGEPIVMHVSKDYVPPTPEPVEVAPVTTAAPAALVVPTPEPVQTSWLDELQDILVRNGGW